MALSAEAFERRSRPGVACGIAVLLDELDDADRKVLSDALAEPTSRVQHAQIARVLTAEGYTVTALTVGRHRNGACSCGR